jgi:hypothetical protein
MYLCGERGVYNSDPNELLVDDFLTTLGFPVNLQADLVARFRDLVEDWTRPDVNPKYFTTSFRKLDTAFSPESFVDWYTHFVYDLQRYDICLVPFDAIVLRWNYVGLCLPGVGEIRYTAMGQALFSILDKVLPSNNPTVSDCVVSLLGFRHDGYRLLYLVMSRTLPVFCPSKPSSPPVWDDTPSVPQMAKLWNLYYRFNVKKGAYFSPIERGLLFLDSIKDHSLVGIVASLKGSLQSFCDSVEEFDSLPPLPEHLTIDGMVQTITTTTSPVTSSMGFARANKLVPLLETPASRADITIPNIQGAEFLSANATSTRQPPNLRGRRNPAPRVGNGLVCRACLRKNHEEVTCRDLAKLLILTNRIASLPATLKKKILDNYYKHYGAAPSPEIHRSYAQQLESFCLDRGISEDDLVRCYDWDYYCDPNPQDGEGDAVSHGGAEDSE